MVYKVVEQRETTNCCRSNQQKVKSCNEFSSVSGRQSFFLYASVFLFFFYSPLPNVRKRMWHVGCGKWSSKGRHSLLLGSIRIVLSCWACTELGIVVCCMLYVQQSDCQLGCGLSTWSSALPLCGMALSLVDEVEVKARAMNGTGCQ